MARAQRLFVALWPPAGVAQQLASIASALQAECGGRKIVVQNQHLTIFFWGAIAAGLVPQVERAVQRAADVSFDLALDVMAHRRRGGLLWVQATEVPNPLAELVERLRADALSLGLRVEDRPFVPHLTLLREARKPARLPALASLQWRVAELTLVRSHLERSGARYEIVRRVPLARGSGA